MKKHTLKRIIALLCACALTFLGVIGSPVTARAEHREYPYDVDTEWTPDDVEEMIDYATQWVGKIDYASSQNNTDPGNRRHEELHSGGATDCRSASRNSWSPAGRHNNYGFRLACAAGK